VKASGFRLDYWFLLFDRLEYCVASPVVSLTSAFGALVDGKNDMGSL
jgi:hypothetical protein